MAIDVTYTNGVIAAKEKYLLKDKIFRFAEMTAEDAFRSLVESGFGNGVACSNAYAFESLITAEESALDEFIRTYAPSLSERRYLLSPRDFHNAKALLKATYLKSNVEKMLAPKGEIDITVLETCVKNGEFSPLKENPYLQKACEQAWELLQGENVSGAEIGLIFEKSAYEYYTTLVKKNSVLKKLHAYRADMTNILTAFRAVSQEEAEKKYLSGGKLSIKQLSKLFLEETKALEEFSTTEFKDFVADCFDAKNKGMPYSVAEKMRDGYEVAYFNEIKYDLKRNEPFLYYVFRRRMENVNVRILFVCLLAGLEESEIKKRLRVV